MDPVDRATDLIRLAAGNPNASESQSAAMKAYAVIREHDLTLVPKKEYQSVLETALALHRENEDLRRRLAPTPERRRRVPIVQGFASQFEGVPEAIGTVAGRAARTMLEEVLGRRKR